MTPTHFKWNKKSKIIMILMGLFLALWVSNYLAGMLCLIFFDQDPQIVQLNTYLYAWQHSYAPSKTSKIVVLAGVIALFICLLPLFLIFITAPKANPNLHGQARFATESEIKQHGFFSDVGLIVGQWGKRLLRFPGNEFVLLSAPTRSGKGVSTVIPTLLSFTDSVVVLDIKGENFQTTSRYRAEQLGHQIYYFNPFVENSARWNPLTYVSRHHHFMSRDLMALAIIIFPEDPQNPFFSNSCRNMFVAIGMLVLETPELSPTIGEIVRQASGKGSGLRDYLNLVLAKKVASTTTCFSPACIQNIHNLLQNSDETLKNIQSSFMAPLSPWLIPLVDKATSANDFDLCQLRQQKISIYLHIPAGELLQAGFLLNLFFSQLINENVRQLPEENPLLQHQCLLLLDEFTAIGKIEIIAKAVGFIAGYNLRLLIVIQDKAQLVATYGKDDAQNIISNMGLLICFTPKQLEEAEHLSKIIGDHTVTVQSVQHANIGLLNAGQYSQSLSVSEQKRAVMLPQELLAMSDKKLLLVRPGMPVIQAQKIFYFSNLFFTKKLMMVKSIARTIAGHTRKIPLAMPLPAAHWPEFTQAFDQSDFYLKCVLTTSPSQSILVPSDNTLLSKNDNFLTHFAAHSNALFSDNALDPQALDFLAQSFVDQFLENQTISASAS